MAVMRGATVVGHVPRLLFFARDSVGITGHSLLCTVPWFCQSAQIHIRSVLRMRTGEFIGDFLIWRLTLQSPNRQIKTTAKISRYTVLYSPTVQGMAV